MSDYDFSSDQGRSEWPSEYSPRGFGARPPQQYLTPSQEKKRKDLKKTKIGIALFLGAFAAYIVGVPTTIICIGLLLILGAVGLGIAGYIMMIIGGGALPKPHRILVIVSLSVMVVGIIFGIVLGVASAATGSSNPFEAGLKDTWTGQEIIDDWESQAGILWVSIITAVFITAAWAMLFFGASKKWGKILIVFYIVLSLAMAGGEYFLKKSFIDGAIDDVDPQEEYEIEEYSDMSLALSLKVMVADLLGLIPMFLILIVAIGAYVNVKKMEADITPKMDSRLYDLRL